MEIERTGRSRPDGRGRKRHRERMGHGSGGAGKTTHTRCSPLSSPAPAPEAGTPGPLRALLRRTLVPAPRSRRLTGLIPPSFTSVLTVAFSLRPSSSGRPLTSLPHFRAPLVFTNYARPSSPPAHFPPHASARRSRSTSRRQRAGPAPRPPKGGAYPRAPSARARTVPLAPEARWRAGPHVTVTSAHPRRRLDARVCRGSGPCAVEAVGGRVRGLPARSRTAACTTTAVRSGTGPSPARSSWRGCAPTPTASSNAKRWRTGR